MTFALPQLRVTEQGFILPTFTLTPPECGSTKLREAASKSHLTMEFPYRKQRPVGPSGPAAD